MSKAKHPIQPLEKDEWLTRLPFIVYQVHSFEFFYAIILI